MKDMKKIIKEASKAIENGLSCEEFISEYGWDEWMSEFTTAEEGEPCSEAEIKKIDAILIEAYEKASKSRFIDREGRKWELGDDCKVDGNTKPGRICSFSTYDDQVRVFFEDGRFGWYSVGGIYRLDHIRKDVNDVACEVGQTVYFAHPDQLNYHGPMTIKRANDCRHDYVIVKTPAGKMLDVPASELTHEPVVDPRPDVSEAAIQQLTGCSPAQAQDLRAYLAEQGVPMKGWGEFDEWKR